MIIIKNVREIDGQTIDVKIESPHELVIEAEGLTRLPALIDPHVHFRTPGMEEKENWITAAQAAIAGGYTTVFDMPNTLPPTITLERLMAKKKLIDAQLKEAQIPLRYDLFFGADKHHLDQIPKVKNTCIGIKIFMGCSTGNLVIDDDESLQAVFKIAAEAHCLVAVHAEDEHLMRERKKLFQAPLDYAVHSQIRNSEVASRAVEKAILLSKRYGTRLYILHVSTQDELALIKQAKKEGLPVYAETTPHHLFLNETVYENLGGKAVVNPPLRTPIDQEALWAAIHDGTIDTMGSDHAPHLLTEKNRPYGECPSGMPGIETTLPLLLNAYHEHRLTLPQLISLTSKRAQDIFHLATNSDMVLVDLEKSKMVSESTLKTKCGWSSFSGRRLKGWPVYTLFKEQCFGPFC